MVSVTRSQSRLSGSSILTGQEGDVNAGEVNSTDVSKQTRTRRRTKTQPNLDSIAEDVDPISTQRKNTRSSSKKTANTDEDNDAVIDKLADQIFAAIDQAFANNNDDDGDESDDDEDDDTDIPQLQKNLTWKPTLTLPQSNKQRKSTNDNSNNTDTTTSINHLANEKRGNTSKLLHIPPPDQRAIDRTARKNAPDTAGKNWFDLPATEITDEIKTDLRVLRLRSALDPKSFYKKFDTTKFPKHFQMGTVVEGPTEYYSSRLTNKQRKRTMAEEIMADDHLSDVRKKRYTKMQEEKAYWSSKKGRKTDNPRLKKKAHRPKH